MASASRKKRIGQLFRVLVLIAVLGVGYHYNTQQHVSVNDDSTTQLTELKNGAVSDALASLPIKGRAPKTGYTRAAFSDGWQAVETCDVRNKILARDMKNLIFRNNTCVVEQGTLTDPYTSRTISFTRGQTTSAAVQIDHVVALSDAWQKGAQLLSAAERYALANDPLNLLAVDGSANQNKSDGDAATWLPANKSFRCSYVARQIAVKQRYHLWVTRSEYDAMATILNKCPDQQLPADTALAGQVH